MAEGDAPQERPRAASAPTASGESTTIDYYFDCIVDDASGAKTVVCYAYGMEIDRRSDSAGEPQSWTDLMTACMPAIQADVDAYGIG